MKASVEKNYEMNREVWQRTGPILLRNRRDREGSNWFNKLYNFLRAKIMGQTVHYFRMKFEDSIWTKPFIKLGVRESLENIEKLLGEKIQGQREYTAIVCGGIKFSIEGSEKCGWTDSLITAAAQFVKETKMDCISAFGDHFKKDFLKEIIEEGKSLKLPWGKGEKIICIHQRLGDVCRKDIKRHYKEILSRSKGVRDFIDGKGALCKTIKQFPFDMEHLDGFLKRIKIQYPNHQIHFITAPSDRDALSKKFPQFKVHAPDKNEAIWAMVNSDVLVISRSYFSAVAGILHTGSRVYYPIWPEYTAMGLGTQFDKTNWEVIRRDGEAGKITEISIASQQY